MKRNNQHPVGSPGKELAKTKLVLSSPVIPAALDSSTTASSAALRNAVANGGFSADDIVNAGAIIAQLCDASNPLMKFLAGKCTETGLGQLAQYLDPATDWAKLKVTLVDQLNIIVGGEAIFDNARFAGVKLRKHTRKLLAKGPVGPALVHAQRLLVEDIFPDAISRSQGRGRNQIQKAATVHRLKKKGKWAVLVTLVKPRQLEGRMRSGRQKFERQTEELANNLCVEINNQLFDRKLARELSARENEIAKKFFWEILEPRHPEWIECLDKVIAHCEATDFRVDDGDLPTVLQAARIFWREHLSQKRNDTQKDYRYALGFLLAAFGKNKTNELTDRLIITLARGGGPLMYLSSSARPGMALGEFESRLWDTEVISKSARPWNCNSRNVFLRFTRAFKNWMHHSLTPDTQEKRKWCTPSEILLSQPSITVSEGHADAKAQANRQLDAQCRKLPALTIQQP